MNGVYPEVLMYDRPVAFSTNLTTSALYASTIPILGARSVSMNVLPSDKTMDAGFEGEHPVKQQSKTPRPAPASTMGNSNVAETMVDPDGIPLVSNVAMVR